MQCAIGTGTPVLALAALLAASSIARATEHGESAVPREVLAQV